MPVLHVDGPGLAAAGVEGVGEAALDGAQAHDDVAARARDARGLAAVEVREGVDFHARELLRNGVGDGVHEADHRARAAALRLVDSAAGGAPAGIVPVVHRDGEDVVVRVFPRPAPDALDAKAQHVRVGQAKLRALAEALSVDHREVLRMRVKPARDRHERVERVAEVVEHRPAALLRGDGRAGGVEPQLHGERAVHGLAPEQLAHAEGRALLGHAQRQADRTARDDLAVLREEAASGALEQRIRAVDAACGFPRGERDALRGDAQTECAGGQVRRAAGEAQRIAVRGLRDGMRAVVHARQIAGKLPGGVAHGRGGVRRADDGKTVGTDGHGRTSLAG